MPKNQIATVKENVVRRGRPKKETILGVAMRYMSSPTGDLLDEAVETRQKLAVNVRLGKKTFSLGYTPELDDGSEELSFSFKR